MGTYLRALGVSEMIKLVSAVQDQMTLGKPLVGAAVTNNHGTGLNRQAY
jgi:hypothetical protein